MLSRALYRYVIIPSFESVYKQRKTMAYWRSLEQSQWQDLAKIEEHQFRCLSNLMTHAYNSTEFYRSTWDASGIRPDQIQSPADLSRLPLLTKDNIREHRLELHCQDQRRPLIAKSTGGSTGAPLQFDLNQDSHERRVAAMVRGYSWAGASPGTKQFFLWGIPQQHRARWQVWKDRVYDLIQRRRVVNSFSLSDEMIPVILGEYNTYTPDTIVAYTSALYQLARGIEMLGLKPWRPKSIVVGAEKLYDYQRAKIESVFQTPVYETYGSQEFMLIGAECSEHYGLHLTSENLFVEIVDDDGSPTTDGEVGNVVVTDLYNYGMPFIRYQTGDRAIAGFRQCPCGRGLPLLQEVRGRLLDILRSPDGRRTPCEFFPHLLKDFDQIRKFQIVQRRPDHVEIRVVLDQNWSATDENLLLGSIRRQLGPTVSVDWRPQTDIPLTHAGKHRVVVNECTQMA